MVASLIAAEALLLEALYRGPGYGLELIDWVKRRLPGRVGLGPGNAYPALARLARRGLVRSWITRSGRGRPRRYYELTPAGIDRAIGQRRLLAALVASEPPLRRPQSRRSEMARRIDECVELSELGADLREQVAGRG